MYSDEPLRQEFAVDAAGLTRFPAGTDAPIWWGILGLILIELSVVFVFVVSGLYLQMMNDPWPAIGMPVPDLLLPTLSLLVMLGSCVTMYLAGKAISRDRVRRFVVMTFSSVLLAGVVLVLRSQQLQQLEFGWDQHVYGSLVWTISGFHFLHVVSALIGTAVIGLLGVLGFFDSRQKIGVVVDTLYWNFVALAWIPFYAVVYWAPRLL